MITHILIDVTRHLYFTYYATYQNTSTNYLIVNNIFKRSIH